MAKPAGPYVTQRPPCETFTFYVANCPPVRQQSGTMIDPDKIIIEKRPRGRRALVFGPTRYGYRSAVFNLNGYERNRPVPGWVVALWMQAKDR